jgi:hypothetical protein
MWPLCTAGQCPRTIDLAQRRESCNATRTECFVAIQSPTPVQVGVCVDAQRIQFATWSSARAQLNNTRHAEHAHTVTLPGCVHAQGFMPFMYYFGKNGANDVRRRTHRAARSVFADAASPGFTQDVSTAAAGAIRRLADTIEYSPMAAGFAGPGLASFAGGSAGHAKVC